MKWFGILGEGARLKLFYNCYESSFVEGTTVEEKREVWCKSLVTMAVDAGHESYFVWRTFF